VIEYLLLDMKEEALAVSTDLEHRFDLAIQLGKLDIATDIAREVNREDRWKTLGDAALSSWKVRKIHYHHEI